jgi:hypothetical protein
MVMDAPDAVTSRLWMLAEDICKNIKNAHPIRVVGPSGHVSGGKRVLYIKYDDREITIPVSNSFLNGNDDQAVMTYIVRRIVLSL